MALQIEKGCQCPCGCPVKIGQIVNGRCRDCDHSNHYNPKTEKRTGSRFGFKVRRNSSR